MLLSVLFAALTQSATEAPSPELLVPRDYLTIEAVDRRGRRPIQPDAVYRDHIWSLESPAPEAGKTAIGEKETEQEWRKQTASEKGQLGGSPSYAYTTVEMSERRACLAKLSGAWTLYVNGRAYFGDAYRFGFGGVPVVLDAGVNHIYVTGIRGSFGLNFSMEEEGVLYGGWDDTLPHLVLGEEPRGSVGFELSNVSERATGPLRIEWEGAGIESGTLWDPGLQSLGTNQFSLPLSGPPVQGEAPHKLTVHVRSAERVDSGAGSNVDLSFSLSLEVRGPDQKRKRTYISAVDGATVEYAIVPPLPMESGAQPDWMGLALSLHGASVSSWGQARAYTQKHDFWIATPMNRRPYGFDWQDWGRRDAYDVLQLAMEESGVDPRYRYVTGHSMGGHGTWHLAANDLDGFAACAPSAGWESFDSYGGRPEGALTDVWHAADASSRTLSLIGNLKQLPTFIVHGTADNNVPATEALTMMEALTKAGGTFEAHFEGGAGHWWGNRCVDWPGIFDHFRQTSIPVEPSKVDFYTVDPSIDADHHWVRVEQPLAYGEIMRVKGEWNQEERTATLTTENVALFSVQRDLVTLQIDGQNLQVSSDVATHWFRRSGDSWSVQNAGPGPDEKSAQSSGPFKRAFDRKFQMVVGTQGSPAENAALLAAAQLQAGSWRYRANGRAVILTDEQYLAGGGGLAVDSESPPNVLLYGNRTTNLAWSETLAPNCPIDVLPGRVALKVGGDEVTREGSDLVCVFVYPGKFPEQLVGVFGFSGMAAARLSSNLQPFKSGAGYPDFTLFDSSVLTEGDGGVLRTGWFDSNWEIGEQ
jgi:poly(3-hydroxybutyrate) depolymerase